MGSRVNGSYYRVMGFISFSIDFDHYEEYSRTQKNILDTISNICSLTMTVFRVLSFLVTTFYSNNFDNYKIIEKMMTNQGKISEKNPKKQKITELSEDNNKKIVYWLVLLMKKIEQNRTKRKKKSISLIMRMKMKIILIMILKIKVLIILIIYQNLDLLISFLIISIL